MALTGHSGTQTAQSMQSSGSMTRKFGPSRKASTGHTSTQSVYLQRMHASVTTKVMAGRVVGQPQHAPPEQHESPTTATGLTPTRVTCTRQTAGPDSSAAQSN